MKKILLGTSALIAFGSIAIAAEAPKLTISGQAEVALSVIGMKNNLTGDNVNTSGFLPTGHDITMPSGSNEIHFKADGKADSGLAYGAKYEIRPGTGPDALAALDEAVIYFSGDWGRIDLGQEDAVGELMTINGAQSTGATGAWAGDTWLTAKDTAQNLSSLANNLRRVTNANDASKVSYRTPSINGIQAGASFIPAYGTAYVNVFDAAVRYDQKIGDIGFGIYGEMISGKAASNLDVVGGVTQTYYKPNTTNLRKFSVGAQVIVGAIKVSSSIVNHGKSGIEVTPSAGKARNAGRFMDVGVSYTMPDGTVVGAGLATAKQSYVLNASQVDDATATWLTVGATTPIAAGLTAFAEYNNEQTDTGNIGTVAIPRARKTTGQELLLGTKISF